MKRYSGLTHIKTQRGVVLLTCLVFLLVLLAMLRYTITSARIEEQKVGIDLDLVSAREAAQSALNFVEFYLNRQGELYCIDERTKTGEDLTKCPILAGAYANVLFRKDDSFLKAITLSDPDLPPLNTLIENGIYSGIKVEEVASKGCIPTWVCVNWPSAGSVIENAYEQRPSGVPATLNSVACPKITVSTTTGSKIDVSACNADAQMQPHFIIERLKASDLDPSKQSLAVEGSPSSRGVTFRVTAVGYGKGVNNITSVMLQSTYVIPNI